jgi:putative MFS transporter
MSAAIGSGERTDDDNHAHAEMLAARLDRVPVGKFHRRLLGVIGAGMFFDSFDLYLAGAVLGTLLHDKYSTLAENAQFISMTFAGMVIGAIGAGILGDRFGRRFTYQFNLAIFGAGSLACAVAPSMAWLIGARFVTGIGLGAEIVIGYATMIEFVPPTHRGRWAALLSFVTNLGLLASMLMGWLIIPPFGWRWMFVFAGVGAFFVLWLRKSMPESPRWLAARGRMAEAEQVICSIERESGLPPGYTEVAALGAKRPLLTKLSRRELSRRLILGSLLQIVAGVASYGFVVWVPTFLVKQGVNINGSLGQSVLMSLGGPFGAGIGFLLCDHIKRRPAIIGASLLAVVCGMVFSQANTTPMAVASGFVMFSLLFFLVANVVAGYVPELFPTPIRMRANGTCSMVGRFATIGIPYAVLALFNVGGKPAVLVGVTACLLIQAVAVWAFGPETSRLSLDAVGVQRD